MRLLKERKQNSGTPCAKTQGFEKRGVRLKCSIGKGKIARLGLNYYIEKSEQPGVREISRQQRAKNTRIASLSCYQSHLNEKQTPVEYLPTRQNMS